MYFVLLTEQDLSGLVIFKRTYLLNGRKIKLFAKKYYVQNCLYMHLSDGEVVMCHLPTGSPNDITKFILCHKIHAIQKVFPTKIVKVCCY